MNSTPGVADSLMKYDINSNMGRTTILLLCVLLLAVCALPAGADPAGPQPGQAARRPVLGLGAQTGLALADEPIGPGYPPGFFTAKTQVVGALNILLEVPLSPTLSLGAGLQLHGTTSSSLEGGWSYRAHWGLGLRAGLGYGLWVSHRASPVGIKAGATAGVSGNFDLYSFTSLFLFYPGAFLEPYILIDDPKRRNWSFAVALPVDLYRRRDLGFYGSVGLGVIWRYTLQ